MQLECATPRCRRRPPQLCRRKLEEVPPLLPEGVTIGDPAWERVAIKYLASGEPQLAAHLHPGLSMHSQVVLAAARLGGALRACTAPPHPPAGAELLRYASLLQLLQPPPDLLLVDDLHTLLDLPAADRPRPRDMALCRVLAALREAVVSGGGIPAQGWCEP